MDDEIGNTLATVGPRLRAVREQRQTTLAQLSQASGVSVSTLSRLESGGRKPTLELLLRVARAHEMPVGELLTEPPTTDPRLQPEPITRNGRTMLPLTRRPGGVQAYKIIIAPGERQHELQFHQGYEWMYVLNGQVRLLLGELDIIMRPGEVAEFDTHSPHWFGSADQHPVELLVLFGPQGERLHVRARPRATTPS
ncbi:MAG: helix-turn-helix domain-containing protein [Streptosporangiaceae bacterium]